MLEESFEQLSDISTGLRERQACSDCDCCPLKGHYVRGFVLGPFLIIPRQERRAYGPTDDMGKLRRRNKGTSGDPDDLYCRRTSSSETPETVTNLLELEWADAPDGDPVRSEAVKQKPVSRQSSMGMGNRQWQSPLGRPISQPAPAPVARDVEPAKQPGSQSKSMLALLSATFPDVPSDDLTQSAIEVRSSSGNGSLSVCTSSLLSFASFHKDLANVLVTQAYLHILLDPYLPAGPPHPPCQLCEALSPLRHIGFSPAENEDEPMETTARAVTRAGVGAGGEEPETVGAHDAFARAHKQALASSRPLTAPDDNGNRQSRQLLSPQDDARRNPFVVLGASTGHAISRPASKEGLRVGSDKDLSRGNFGLWPEDEDACASASQRLHQIIDRGTIRPKSMLRSKPNREEAHDTAHIIGSETGSADLSDDGIAHALRRMGHGQTLTMDAWEQSFFSASVVAGSQHDGVSSGSRPSPGMDGRGWARATTAASVPIAGMVGFVDQVAGGHMSTQNYDVISHTHTSASKAFSVRGTVKIPPKGLHNNVRRSNQTGIWPPSANSGDHEQHLPSESVTKSPAMMTFSYGRPDDVSLDRTRPATAYQLQHNEQSLAARNAAAVEARREQLRRRKAEEASRKEKRHQARQHLQTMRMQSAREEKDSRWKKAFIRRAQEVDRCREVASRTGARPGRVDSLLEVPVTVVNIHDGSKDTGADVAGIDSGRLMSSEKEQGDGVRASGSEEGGKLQGILPKDKPQGIQTHLKETRIPVSPTIVSIITPTLVQKDLSSCPVSAADGEAAVPASTSTGASYRLAVADAQSTDRGAARGGADLACGSKEVPERPSSSFQTFSAFLPGGCGAIPLRIASSASLDSFGRTFSMGSSGGFGLLDGQPPRPQTMHGAATRGGKQHARADGHTPGDLSSAGQPTPLRMLRSAGESRVSPATGLGGSCAYVRASPLMVHNNLATPVPAAGASLSSFSAAPAAAAAGASPTTGRPLSTPDLTTATGLEVEFTLAQQQASGDAPPIPPAIEAATTVPASSQQKRLGPLGGKVVKPRPHSEGVVKRTGAAVPSKAAASSQVHARAHSRTRAHTHTRAHAPTCARAEELLLHRR